MCYEIYVWLFLIGDALLSLFVQGCIEGLDIVFNALFPRKLQVSTITKNNMTTTHLSAGGKSLPEAANTLDVSSI